MIVEPNKKDFGPEIPIKGVLRFHDGEIVARGNDAAVENDEIIFSRSQNHSFLASRDCADQQGRADNRTDLAKQMIFHG
jgi:hypothetical protein